MENICINLAIRLIKDGKESNLFELHRRFRLTYEQALEAVKYLETLDIVNFDGKRYSLKTNVTAEKLAPIYKLLKQRKLNLDGKDILMYKNNSLAYTELYYPKFTKLDSSLLIDELK